LTAANGGAYSLPAMTRERRAHELAGTRAILGAAALALALVFVAAAAAPARAGAPDHEMEIKAREVFAAGKYEEALGLFAKLYAETLHPVYLRNIGRCHQKMRKPDRAIDSFKDYLAKAKKATRAERAEVEGYIREMEALKEEQARAAQPAADTKAPVPPPPPPAAAEPPSAAAGPPAVRPPTDGDGGGGGGEGTNLVSRPPPPPRDEPTPVYKRWWFWTGIGVVVAGGVVAAVLLTQKGSACPADQCK